MSATSQTGGGVLVSAAGGAKLSAMGGTGTNTLLAAQVP